MCKIKAGMLTHTGFPLGIVCSPLEGCCGGNGGNIFCLLNHQAALLPRGQRAVLTELVCFNKLLFSNDFEGNLDSDLFVEVKFGVVFADFLDGVFDFDDLAVDLVAESLEGVGDLDAVD